MSMTDTLATRPFEEEALFNPALLVLLVRSAANEHEQRSSGRLLPTPLVYLLVPLALHGPTRRSLPRNVTAQMGEWIRSHPEALIGLDTRARALLGYTSAGLRLGLAHGALVARDSAIAAGPLRRRPPGMARTAEVDECVDKAGFLGRWFSEQPDWITVMAWWGLRP